MNDLETAYRSTSYDVDAPEGRIAIRIGQHSPLLDRLLRRHHTRTWAFLTAANPRSRLLMDEENERRNVDLEQVVQTAGYPHYRGESVADDGVWSPEPSFLIVGITQKDAAILGRSFGQNALVLGELGEPARLMWL
jgi:hypothetical protein